MKTIINIRNLTITLPNQGESKPSYRPARKSDDSYQPLTKDKAVDGVYIYTDSNHLWLPQFWGLSDEKPQSVVVIKGDRRLCISLKGSADNIVLLDPQKKQTGKCLSVDDALIDWNGYQNTEELCRLGSPAAKYCKELGDKWYIPAIGEFNFLQSNKNLIDSALTICGGEPFYYGLHWSSTKIGAGINWVFDWINGDRFNSIFQHHRSRVRPVSAFL